MPGGRPARPRGRRRAPRRLCAPRPAGGLLSPDRPPPLLRAEGLGRTYRPRRGVAVEALRDVSLRLAEGETVGLVGESGSGKSTLARCLCLLERADRGAVYYRDREIGRLAGAELRRHRRRVQLIFQDPARAFNPRMTAAEIVEEPLLIAGVRPAAERRRRAAETVDGVGLAASLLGRRALELSGGQRQRLAIARALVLRPRALVLDEALTGLDPSVKALVMNLLTELQARHGLAYLQVSHDLGTVRQLARRVVVMRRGRIVERGAVEAIFERPKHPLTRSLVAAAGVWPPAPRGAPGAAA